ncbi:hypothetical protein G6F68_012752 [Rhizopus microsporus]|nr:hypothetical protein G6F68_012752 [Rhizopus microsporus]
MVLPRGTRGHRRGRAKSGNRPAGGRGGCRCSLASDPGLPHPAQDPPQGSPAHGSSARIAPSRPPSSLAEGAGRTPAGAAVAVRRRPVLAATGTAAARARQQPPDRQRPGGRRRARPGQRTDHGDAAQRHDHRHRRKRCRCSVAGLRRRWPLAAARLLGHAHPCTTVVAATTVPADAGQRHHRYPRHDGLPAGHRSAARLRGRQAPLDRTGHCRAAGCATLRAGRQLLLRRSCARAGSRR